MRNAGFAVVFSLAACAPRAMVSVRTAGARASGDELAPRTAVQGAPRAEAGCDAACRVDALVTRARAYRESRTPEGSLRAQEALRRALAEDPANLAAANELALGYLDEASDDPRPLTLAAQVCSRAISLAQRVSEASPPRAREGASELFNTCGIVAWRRGQIAPASEYFRAAAVLAPARYEAWANYGALSLSYYGHEQAREAFERAVALRPQSYEAHLALGVAHRGLGHFEAAERAYVTARLLDPRRPEAFFNLGVLYEHYLPTPVSSFTLALAYYESFLARTQFDPRYAAAVLRTAPHLRAIRNAICAVTCPCGSNALNAAVPSPPTPDPPLPAWAASVH